MVRNPATGEQIKKDADKVVKMTIAKALKDKGFNKVFVLKGGYGAWRNAGLP